MSAINADQDIENADWIKKSWDFPENMTVDQLKMFIHDQGLTIEEFKELPVYKWNKDKVKILQNL
jgi:hypothetical protein